MKKKSRRKQLGFVSDPQPMTLEQRIEMLESAVERLEEKEISRHMKRCGFKEQPARRVSLEEKVESFCIQYIGLTCSAFSKTDFFALSELIRDHFVEIHKELAASRGIDPDVELIRRIEEF